MHLTKHICVNLRFRANPTVVNLRFRAIILIINLRFRAESAHTNLRFRDLKEKYKLSSLGKQARFRSFEDSFVWLNEAMIVNTCFNSTDPHVGLALSADNATQKLLL